ncbi:hypothetical protein SARC_09466 [Sphaeroforma arctica JP610]|uniref:Uncharacterized protein n=1 Tax=Sphaeroforma arctica JP610 TaxID=667725 RepID=A0A0L0FQ40_9EUKA|nr:hypothetical protein SARC_09466 [Sphaeroforma arctica JP610]KNC78088.1 hypothetical protein SARC_09466 [Sphaeroforma arctica JP610]|eukprot:XP_014151990.1 hypothetical protein SARC_09466 [Sphaeroforma arctica JP610]
MDTSEVLRLLTHIAALTVEHYLQESRQKELSLQKHPVYLRHCIEPTCSTKSNSITAVQMTGPTKRPRNGDGDDEGHRNDTCVDPVLNKRRKVRVQTRGTGTQRHSCDERRSGSGVQSTEQVEKGDKLSGRTDQKAHDGADQDTAEKGTDEAGTVQTQGKKYLSKFERKKAKKQAQALQKKAQAATVQGQTGAIVDNEKGTGGAASAGGAGVTTAVEGADGRVTMKPAPRTKAPKKGATCKETQKTGQASTPHTLNTPPPMSAAAQRVLDSLMNGAESSVQTSPGSTNVARANVKGTLSDRLNPGHKYYDAHLKTQWKTFSKRDRARIVAVDKAQIAAHTQHTTDIHHPFPANSDDHCESPPEAYLHIEGVLGLVAEVKGCTRAQLRIYDPYYCAGAMAQHLGELGFTNVYNKCEDFYRVIAQGTVPEHDVVVTNPPYSGDHVDRLLQWVSGNGKPFLLLMPNYFCAKPYYAPALGGEDRVGAEMSYLCPRKRYNYWTPKGMREADKVQKQHTGAGGYRTSPFISFWYVNLLPVISRTDLFAWDRRQRRVDPTAHDTTTATAASASKGSHGKGATVKNRTPTPSNITTESAGDGESVVNGKGSVAATWTSVSTCSYAVVLCTGDTLPPAVQPRGSN